MISNHANNAATDPHFLVERKEEKTGEELGQQWKRANDPFILTLETALRIKKLTNRRVKMHHCDLVMFCACPGVLATVKTKKKGDSLASFNFLSSVKYAKVFVTSQSVGLVEETG